jgi:hypothetical protein
MGPLFLRLGRPAAWRQEHPPLSQLVKQRKFDEIIEILQFKGTIGLESWLGIVSNNMLKGEDDATLVEPKSASALHAIMLHRPPVAVVDMLIQKLTEIKRGYIPEATVDALGRTPLHVAVEAGCDISVIKRLTASSELPVLTMDSAGRFPLHYACGPPARGRGMKHNAVDTVNHLVEIYPKAVIVTDSSGKTPFDLATDHKADKRILLGLTMVQQILRKSAPGSVERTTSTTTFADVPHFVSRNAEDIDDMSSVGSRGISRHRRRSMLVAI